MPAEGDRVVIHLGGVPDEVDAHKGETLPCGGKGFGHLPEHEGRTGVIKPICDYRAIPCLYGELLGHGYVVAYDEPFRYRDYTCYGGHFAADELTVLAAGASVSNDLSALPTVGGDF